MLGYLKKKMREYSFIFNKTVSFFTLPRMYFNFIFFYFL